LFKRCLIRSQAVFYGVMGKSGVMLLTGETFFLGRGYDLAITNEGGGTVMVEGGDAEDSHCVSLGLETRI